MFFLTSLQLLIFLFYPKVGTSLRNLIDEEKNDTKADNTTTTTLTERIRNATSELDIRIFSGPVRYEPGRQESLLPAGFEQTQRSKENEIIYIDRGAASENQSDRYTFVNSIWWRTKDGSKPKFKLTTTTTQQYLEWWAVLIVAIPAVCNIIAIFLALFFLFYFRELGKMQMMNPKATIIILFGVLTLHIPILLYFMVKDGSGMASYCQRTVPIVSIGFSLLTWGLYFKFSESVKSHIRLHVLQSMGPEQLEAYLIMKTEIEFKTWRNYMLIILAWISFTLALIICWYTLGEPPTKFDVSHSVYNQENDEMVVSVWTICSTSGDKSMISLILSASLLTIHTLGVAMMFF